MLRLGANVRAILAKRGQAGLADADAPLVFNGGEMGKSGWKSGEGATRNTVFEWKLNTVFGWRLNMVTWTPVLGINDVCAMKLFWFVFLWSKNWDFASMGDFLETPNV